MTLVKFSDVVTINPKEKLPKGSLAHKVAMEGIQPYTKFIQNYIICKYTGGTKFRNDDTLFARITPSLENGKTSFVTKIPKGSIGFGSTEFLVFRPTDKILPDYLYYLATTNTFREMAIKSMTGTSGRQRVQTDVVANYVFDLPSIEKQQTIVSKLNPLDHKINLNGKINDNLFELSNILFEAVLEDDRSELTNLANLTDIQNGFAFKSREYIGFSDTPIVRTLNIGADNLFDMQNLKYISDESRTKYQKFEFKTFDTALVMVGASIGKTGFVTSRTNGGLQNQNMWRFRPLNSEMPGLYIYNLVTYANSQMQGYKTGSAREFYTKDAFKNFEVPVGNADIYKVFFAIQDLLDNNASQTTTLTAMRDEILTQVMA